MVVVVRMTGYVETDACSEAQAVIACMRQRCCAE